MESYKKKAHDSQKQIKLLESRNAELQQSIGLHSTLPATKSLGSLNTQKEGSYLRRHSTSSGGTPKNQKLVLNHPDSPPTPPPVLLQSNWTDSSNNQDELNINSNNNNNNTLKKFDNDTILTIETDLTKWIHDKIDLLMNAKVSRLIYFYLFFYL